MRQHGENVWRPWQRARRGRGRRDCRLGIERDAVLRALPVSPSSRRRAKRFWPAPAASPASMVSASGTTAERPAALNTLKPSARLAPEPPQSSGTHAKGNPASVSACQSGAFHSALLVVVDGLGVSEDQRRFSPRSRQQCSHSPPQRSPILNWHASGPAVPPGPRCGLFLRSMMRKSHSRDKRCPQGRLRGRHEAHQAMTKFRPAEASRI